jgi:hypothetical protein
MMQMSWSDLNEWRFDLLAKIEKFWFDLTEWWSDLFENLYVLAGSILFCIGVVIVSTVVIVRGSNAAVRKLAWRILLASVASYLVAVILSVSRLPLVLETFLIRYPLEVGIYLLIWVLNYWCVPILLVWRYKDKERQHWHAWANWVCTTVWTLWSVLLHGMNTGGFIQLGAFVWIPPVITLIAIIIVEIGLQLKLTTTRGRILIAGALIILSAALLVSIVTYESPRARQRTPNAIVRAGKIPFAFPESFGRKLRGCIDPSETLLWINIVTGRLYAKEGQDGARRTQIPATQSEVEEGMSNFKGICSEYWDDQKIFVGSEAKTWNGVDMRCIKSLFFIDKECVWLPAAVIDPIQPESRQR